MGFFSLGKKDNKQKELKKEEIITLNRRKFDRYIIKNGDIIDISKKGAKIRKKDLRDIDQEFLQLKIDSQSINCKVVQDKKDFFSVEFLDDFEKVEFIKNNIHKLEFSHLEKKIKDIDFDICSKNDTLRAVINLLAELEDPNTTSEKMILYIRQIPDLEQEILEVANSVEEKVMVEIKDLPTAIARLGFNRLKKIVRDVVNKKISISENSLSFFEYFEAFNIFKTIFFKETAPLFSFRDVKNEGRTLLSTETAIFSYFTNQKLNVKKFYKNSLRLYSGYSRVLERELFGIDVLDLGRRYFVDYLGFFKYLYDGYILAHLFLNPFLDLDDLKLSLSQRKLRFAYVAYLTFVTTIGVLQRDRKYMYISLNRLSRSGMDTGKVLEYINSVVSTGNNALSNMGLRRSLKPASIPTYSISLKKLFPENIYFSYLIERLSLIKRSKRCALRHEDRSFAGYMLGVILNSQEADLKDQSFCVIPCKNLDDEEIDINMFEGFDVVIFKDIDLLPEHLLKDFYKIWEEFEGIVISTFSTYSFLDFNKPALYSFINPYIVDLPSYFNDSCSYDLMKDLVKDDIKQFFDDISFRDDKFLDYENKSLDFVVGDVIKTSDLFR